MADKPECGQWSIYSVARRIRNIYNNDKYSRPGEAEKGLERDSVC